MEQDPSLDEFNYNVRNKPEVRLPCADCGELLYLTVPHCPHCRSKSVTRPCAWCKKDMRVFFSLADRQQYCQDCEWKLNREKMQCGHCGKSIAMDEEFVTYARRIMHATCLAEFENAQGPAAADEQTQSRLQMEAARRQLAESMARQAAPAKKDEAAPNKGGCAGVVMAVLVLLLFVLIA